MPEEALCLRAEALVPTAELRSLALGSDGACDLVRAGAASADLFGDDLLFRNPDALRRRLFLLARDLPGPAPRPGPLRDDTTLVLIRRSTAPSPGRPPTLEA